MSPADDSKVDKNIRIFTPNGLILKEYIYLFPATNVSNIIHILQILTLNHRHVNFVVPGTKPLYTKREILVRGILAWGIHQTNYLCKVIGI